MIAGAITAAFLVLAQETPPPDPRDADVMGDPTAPTKFSEEAAPEDPLKIGGQLYLRSTFAQTENQSVGAARFGAPSLLDTYLDARPNDRVRGLVLGRMSFDPALPERSEATTFSGMGTPGAGTAALSNLFGGRTRGPFTSLDQMWLRFDVARTVFVTAGRQHVRWGTARFWTPTDYLHVRRRNPLDVFDARTGTTMLKLHLPWEARGWNFYAYALPENAGATATVNQITTAARAEIVLGTTEMGLGVFARRGARQWDAAGLLQDRRSGKPRLALDISTGVGDVDLYGELALRFDPRPEDLHRDRARLQAVGGFSYQRRYNDNDVWSLGGEYFFNQLGYGSPRGYVNLFFPSQDRPLTESPTFFYLGRQYAALFLAIPRPYSWDLTSFTLSTMGNLSDQSFISRLDFSYTLLTHLQVELYAAVHYGTNEGEFRLGVKNLMVGDQTFSLSPSLLDLGFALRMAF